MSEHCPHETQVNDRFHHTGKDCRDQTCGHHQVALHVVKALIEDGEAFKARISPANMKYLHVQQGYCPEGHRPSGPENRFDARKAPVDQRGTEGDPKGTTARNGGLGRQPYSVFPGRGQKKYFLGTSHPTGRPGSSGVSNHPGFSGRNRGRAQGQRHQLSAHRGTGEGDRADPAGNPCPRK